MKRRIQDQICLQIFNKVNVNTFVYRYAETLQLPEQVLSKLTPLTPVNHMSVCPTNSSHVNTFQPDEHIQGGRRVNMSYELGLIPVIIIKLSSQALFLSQLLGLCCDVSGTAYFNCVHLYSCTYTCRVLWNTFIVVL